MAARKNVVMLVAAAALVGASALLAVVAYEGFRLWFAPPPAEAPPPARPPEPREPDPLITGEPDAPTSFIWIPRVKPADFCKALGALGLGRPEFQIAQWPAKGWTCVSDLLKAGPGDESAVSSLFVSARGSDSEQFEGFRLKLNLIDPATAPAARRLGRQAFERLMTGLGFHAPAEALAALDGLKDGAILVHGAMFDFRKEFSSERYNLVVSFPQRLGAGGADRFLPPARGGR